MLNSILFIYLKRQNVYHLIYMVLSWVRRRKKKTLANPSGSFYCAFKLFSSANAMTLEVTHRCSKAAVKKRETNHNSFVTDLPGIYRVPVSPGMQATLDNVTDELIYIDWRK